MPEAERATIASLLRLPEGEREELSVAFRLSELECDALAELLQPTRLDGPSRPSVVIVDAGLLDAADAGTEGQ